MSDSRERFISEFGPVPRSEQKFALHAHNLAWQAWQAAERQAPERAADLAFDEVFAMNNAVAARHVSDAIRALIESVASKGD